MECENKCYYVGETTRLYQRLYEHFEEKGGVNTCVYEPMDIVAIYKMPILGKFFEYNNRVIHNTCNVYFRTNEALLDDFNYVNDDDCDKYDYLKIENNITECLMLNDKKNWKNIRGGKYTRFDYEYSLPINKYIRNLPLCHCGLPCDVKKNNENNYLYFRCAKKNMWADLIDKFDIQDIPCKYFMKYTKDTEYKIYYNKKTQIIRNLTRKSQWLRDLVGGQYQFCIGGCGKEFDGDNTVRYSGRAINLCFQCFIHKYDELSQKYDVLCLVD